MNDKLKHTSSPIKAEHKKVNPAEMDLQTIEQRLKELKALEQSLLKELETLK